MPCPHNKWSGQWYCPGTDEARKGRSREWLNQTDETGGQNESGQWYYPQMDEAGKGRSRERINQTDETGAGNGIALKWTKPEKE